MHEKLQVGDTVMLAAPAGIFTAKEMQKPKVLISAGIGATASYSLLQGHGSGKFNAVFHVDKSAATHPHREAFLSSGIHCLFHYTAEQGRPDLAVELTRLLAVEGVSPDADFYLCGPKGFMAEVQDVLTSLGAQHIFSEIFNTGSLPASKCPFKPPSNSGLCPFLCCTAP